MGRLWRAALVAGVILATTAGPAFAADGEPAVDINDFLPSDIGDWDGDNVPDIFEDTNGDGIPDIPDGIHGIWDDVVGAKTEEEFIAEVDVPETFDFDDDASSLMGPCGGLAISYTSDGESIDAAVDAGDDSPAVDVLTGEQAFTKSNPFKLSSTGLVAYWGFTPDIPTLSLAGQIPDVDYGADQRSFHDHRWEIVILEVSADDGGDPNQNDHNRNAAVVDVGDILQLEFRAKLKARGGIIDLFGPKPKPLPSLTADTIHDTAAGNEYCFGEGWVEFIGPDTFELFTVPGALATALAALGFSGVLFNARPVKSWRA